MKQKEAVYNAILNVMGKIEGDVSATITKEQRASVNQILFQGFRNEEIDLDREFDDAALKVYISGLTSNWLRKDNRLNGGVKYVAKNPGSRAGAGDETLKAIRALKSTTPTTDARYPYIVAAETNRVAELAKAKAPTIDFSR